MKNPGKKLKELLRRQAIIVPGVTDTLGALLVQKHGYQAAYLTGAGLSVTLHGKPDIGLLTLDDVLQVARRITGVIDIPLIVDVDTGFGGEVNVARTVQEMEAAGVAAIQIEDQLFPKRCGHLSGKALITKSEMVKKIQTAVAARKTPDFLIIARTDARGVTGMKDALARALAYKKAGADIVFPEALESADEFRQFGRLPLGVRMANMTEFGRSPALTVQELAHLGFRLVLFPMTAFRVAAFAMERALERLKSLGSTQSFVGQMQTRQSLYELIRYNDFDTREQQFLKPSPHKRKRKK